MVGFGFIFQPVSISQLEKGWLSFMAEDKTLGWEEGLRSSFTTKISMLLNQAEQEELRQKRHLPAVIFVFIFFFSKVALPKAGNGFLPPASCEDHVHGGTQSAKPLFPLNLKSPLVAAVFFLSLFVFSFFFSS